MLWILLCSLSWSHCGCGVRSAIRRLHFWACFFHITWQHHLSPLWQPAELWGSAVPVCLFAPLLLQGKELISGFIGSLFGGCFSWMSVGKCFKWCIFLPFLLPFFMLMTWSGLCLALWLKRGEVCVSPWIPRELFLEPWSKLKEIFFLLYDCTLNLVWKALFQQGEALAKKVFSGVCLSFGHFRLKLRTTVKVRIRGT